MPKVKVCPQCDRFMADPKRHEKHCLARLPKEAAVPEHIGKTYRISPRGRGRPRWFETAVRDGDG